MMMDEARQPPEPGKVYCACGVAPCCPCLKAVSDDNARLLGALGDLAREAAKHIKPGMDGYAHLHFAQELIGEKP